MQTIFCPHCNKEIELSEALTHELKERLLKEQEEKHKFELEKTRKEAIIEAQKSVSEKIEKELTESQQNNKKLQDEVLLLKKNQEEAERKRKEEEEKIKLDAQKKAQEQTKLEMLELRKQLEDTKKALDDAKRKADQRSQQLQGEVLELDLEEKLKSSFPNDQFLPIPKGVEGGDIWQKVFFNGRIVGSILWETKRTKAWSNNWTVKLKDDAARISASESIIVSVVLPNGSTSFDRKDGVWITTYEHALNICRYVRFLITTVATVKFSSLHTEEEWGKVRDYMLGDSFKHRMQTHFTVVDSLRHILDKEKRSAVLRWKSMQAEIDKLDSNTSNLYGELKTIVKELPELDGISSPQLIEGSQDDDDKTLF